MSSYNSKTYISVPFSFWAKHKYDEAPEEVGFLSKLHPHEFKCEVTVEVKHSDRELEFYMVREFLESKVNNIKKEIKINNCSSCEMICDMIKTFMTIKYGYRDMAVEVSEDGIYSAVKAYEVEE